MKPSTALRISNEIDNTEKDCEAYWLMKHTLANRDKWDDSKANRALGYALAVRLIEDTKEISVLRDAIWGGLGQ